MFWVGIGIVFIAFVLLVIAAAKEESHAFPVFVLVVMFTALWYWDHFSIIAWVRENPSTLLWLLPSYFAVGVVWSLCKWYLFLKDKLFDLKEQWPSYQQTYKTFSEFAETRKPVANQQKDRIVYWINFWPVSLFWTVLHELFEKIALRIYNSIRNLYDNLGKKVFNFEEKNNGSS